jgi:hypothetical protein
MAFTALEDPELHSTITTTGLGSARMRVASDSGEICRPLGPIVTSAARRKKLMYQRVPSKGCDGTSAPDGQRAGGYR